MCACTLINWMRNCSRTVFTVMLHAKFYYIAITITFIEHIFGSMFQIDYFYSVHYSLICQTGQYVMLIKLQSIFR